MTAATKILILAMVLVSRAAVGLESDRDQPATVEADEVEYDFRTGERTYKGNVIVTQGSLKITGDKLVVLYKDEKLEKATAWGNPASFKQRPEGKTQDVIGKGKTIILDQVVNTLTLIQTASLQQGSDLATGDEIVYDITTEKLVIKSAPKAKVTAQTGEADAAAGTDGADAAQAKPQKPARAKVTITPTQKPTSQ